MTVRSPEEPRPIIGRRAALAGLAGGLGALFGSRRAGAESPPPSPAPTPTPPADELGIVEVVEEVPVEQSDPPVVPEPTPTPPHRREIMLGEEKFYGIGEPIITGMGTKIQLLESDDNILPIQVINPSRLAEVSDAVTPGVSVNLLFESGPREGNYGALVGAVRKDGQLQNLRLRWRLDNIDGIPAVRIYPTKSDTYNIIDIISNPSTARETNATMSGLVGELMLYGGGFAPNAHLPEVADKLRTQEPPAIIVSAAA